MRQSDFFDDASIARTVETLQKHCADLGFSTRETSRHALAIEEILLAWQAKFGREAEFTLYAYKRFSKITIELTCANTACNPLPQPDAQERFLDAFGRDLLLHLNINAQYTYENGVNGIMIVLNVPRKDNSVATLLWYIGAAIMLSIILKFVPEAMASFAIKEIVTPLVSTFSGFLTATMTFVVFFSVAASIVNLGCVEDLYSFAFKTVKKMLLTTAGFALVAVVTASCFLSVQITAEAQGQSNFGPLRDVVLQFVPTNFTAAFNGQNIPQIVFLAVIFSITILVFNEKLTPLKKIILACNTLLFQILTTLMRILPLFVAGCILQSTSMNFSHIVGFAVSAILISSVLMIVLPGFLWIKALLNSGRSIGHTFLKSTRIYVVSFCTMSSAAVFPLQIVFCRDVLKIPERIYNFVLPVSLIFNKIGDVTIVILITITLLCMSEISITWQGLLLLSLQATILSIAVPPVAGGSLCIIAIVFNQFGISAESMGIATMLIIACDSFIAMGTVIVTQAVVMDVAREAEK